MSPVKGIPVALARGMRVDAAFNAVLKANAAHLRANAAGMLRGRDPEYLHQMRVALRRLRSAMEVFASVVPERMENELRADLKWFSRQLGAARDWDVFVEETLPRIEADSRTRLPGFRARCDTYRRRAGGLAVRAVRSARYRRFSRLLAAGLIGGADEPRGRGRAALLQPLVGDYASAVLEWSDRRLAKAGVKPARLPARELHRFRVALKKFRYAAHFFFGLFKPRAERIALKRLSRLQDILGAINDAAVAEELAAAACVSAPRMAREVTPLVKRWSRRRITVLRRELAVAWKAYRSGGKFW